LARFLLAGVVDAERRIARLTAPIPDDKAVVHLAENSLAAALAGRALAVLVAAVRGSRAIAFGRAAVTQWTGTPWPTRRLIAGTTLIVGASVHVGFAWSLHAPPGWLWLILPGLGLAVGLLLLAASRAPRE
jgi:hypothetical protein